MNHADGLFRMNGRFLKYMSYLVCPLVYAFWYVQAAYCNVFSCDDFWHGINVKSYGFWGAQAWYWQNWEGSFVHTFLATLPHVFTGTRVAFAFNFLSLAILIVSISFFFRTFFSFSRIARIIYSLYVVAIFYSITRGGAEIRFWLSANVPYVFGVASCVAFVSLYHRTCKLNMINAISLFVLALVISGNKLTYILFAFFVLLFYDLIYGMHKKSVLVFVSLALSIGAMINFLSPGNMVRLSENIIHASAFNWSIIDSVGLRVIKTVKTFPFSLLLLPILLDLKISAMKYSRLLIIFSASLVYVVLDSLLMYACFNDGGPNRTLVLPEIAILFSGCLAVRRFVVDLNACAIPFLKNGLVIFSLIYTINLQLPLVAEIDATKIYSELSRIRDEKVKMTNKKDDILKLDPLPRSGLLLSYYANDETWLNNIYLRYFDKAKKCVVIDNKEADYGF